MHQHKFTTASLLVTISGHLDSPTLSNVRSGSHHSMHQFTKDHSALKFNFHAPSATSPSCTETSDLHDHDGLLLQDSSDGHSQDNNDDNCNRIFTTHNIDSPPTSVTNGFKTNCLSPIDSTHTHQQTQRQTHKGNFKKQNHHNQPVLSVHSKPNCSKGTEVV